MPPRTDPSMPGLDGAEGDIDLDHCTHSRGRGYWRSFRDLQALAESAGGTVPPSRLGDELTMHEIFISYRRIDTEESGGHLYDNLRDSFGKDSVFMDTRPGSIAWGA